MPTSDAGKPHHRVVKEQNKKAGQDHQHGNGHLAHAIEQLGEKRQWPRVRRSRGSRREGGDAHGFGYRAGKPVGLPPRLPGIPGGASRRNWRMCLVSSSGCSRGPKCSPPGSSTELQLGSALCRYS